MTKQEKTKKGDFVELEFTGYYQGKSFDSNVEENIKKINPEAKAEKTVVVIGQRLVIGGLDKALEEKEIGEEYEIHVPYKEGFGERKRELVKTIPLNVFTKQKINPFPGQTLVMDDVLARVITISGARVITDFNNPLAGKDVDYKFKIKRIIIDEKEKIEALFKFFFRAIPKYEIKENKIIVKGPKPLVGLVILYKDKFKEIIDKYLEFEEEKIERREKGKAKESEINLGD